MYILHVTLRNKLAYMSWKVKNCIVMYDEIEKHGS